MKTNRAPLRWIHCSEVKTSKPVSLSASEREVTLRYIYLFMQQTKLSRYKTFTYTNQLDSALEVATCMLATWDSRRADRVIVLKFESLAIR